MEKWSEIVLISPDSQNVRKTNLLEEIKDHIGQNSIGF